MCFPPFVCTTPSAGQMWRDYVVHCGKRFNSSPNTATKQSTRCRCMPRTPTAQRKIISETIDYCYSARESDSDASIFCLRQRISVSGESRFQLEANRRKQSANTKRRFPMTSGEIDSILSPEPFAAACDGKCIGPRSKFVSRFDLLRSIRSTAIATIM